MKPLVLKGSEEGFTLLEIIISIGIIAVINVFILRMFLVSSMVNQNAREIDLAFSAAQNAIETFKRQTTLNGYRNEQFLKGCFVKQREKGAAYYQAYDANWNVLDMSKFEEFDSVITPEGMAFLLAIDVAESEVSGPDTYVMVELSASGASVKEKNKSAGKLYAVRAAVSRYKAGASPSVPAAMEEILALGTAKYFPN
jgi:type II secretory pathway pseudopilin PulG